MEGVHSDGSVQYIKQIIMINQSTKYYTGIGSRSTPENILENMTSYAKRLSLFGYTLRSGGADGADTAFEKGSLRNEIYLPWHNFNGREGKSSIPIEAFDIAENIHPNWQACRDGARKLHARNIQQVLGKDLETPSEFVVYWAKESNGEVQGGTRTAVELARQHSIPTYNLGLDRDKKPFKNKMNKLFFNYAKVTLRHIHLFYHRGINERDDKVIKNLLEKQNYNKGQIKLIFRLFKKYKDLNKNPKYLPTYLDNINN